MQPKYVIESRKHAKALKIRKEEGPLLWLQCACVNAKAKVTSFLYAVYYEMLTLIRDSNRKSVTQNKNTFLFLGFFMGHGTRAPLKTYSLRSEKLRGSWAQESYIEPCGIVYPATTTTVLYILYTYNPIYYIHICRTHTQAQVCLRNVSKEGQKVLPPLGEESASNNFHQKEYSFH